MRARVRPAPGHPGVDLIVDLGLQLHLTQLLLRGGCLLLLLRRGLLPRVDPS